MAKKEDVAAAVAEAIKPLTQAISNIQADVEQLKSTPQPSGQQSKVEKYLDNSPEPVPQDFRQAVDTILNQNFGIEIDSRETPGAFGFSVLVPREYSNATQGHWETYKEDRRFKAIPRVEGIEGVKEYVNRVFNNLPQDTRTQIMIDRRAN